MRKTVRDNVFETNSSSMHTVTVRGKKHLANYYNPDTIISVYLDEYGWSGDPCADFISKLQYALSMVLHTEYPGFSYYDEEFTIDQNILEECNGYKLLLNAINNHGKCEKIIIKKYSYDYPYGYIDHQSHEDYNSLQDFLNDWNVDAERFLFDDNVIVWIDNDNH